MTKHINRVILLGFCALLIAPVLPGIGICLGEEGHAAVITTGEDTCCETEGSALPAGSDKSQLAAQDCCIDIPIHIIAGARLLPVLTSGMMAQIDMHGADIEFQSPRACTAISGVLPRHCSSLYHIKTVVLRV